MNDNKCRDFLVPSNPVTFGVLCQLTVGVQVVNEICLHNLTRHWSVPQKHVKSVNARGREGERERLLCFFLLFSQAKQSVFVNAR